MGTSPLAWKIHTNPYYSSKVSTLGAKLTWRWVKHKFVFTDLANLRVSGKSMGVFMDGSCGWMDCIIYFDNSPPLGKSCSLGIVSDEMQKLE